MVLIWGLIAYKIISRDSGETLVVPNSVVVPDTVKGPIVDSFNLLVNYRDPFLGKTWYAPKKKVTASIPKKTVQKPEPQKIVTWPHIQYKGLVSGNNTNIGLIVIGKTQYLLTSGEVKEDVLVENIYEDSITVIYEETKRSIHKK